MANFVYNIAKGRVAEFYNRVDTNDPANSALVLVAVVSTTPDATLKDLDTLSAVLAEALTAEATNGGYARIVLTDTELAALTVDDTGDTMPVDIPDQTFSAIVAGDNWTDIIICYDPDTTGGDDTSLIPLTQHDFIVTPDGSDIIVQVAAGGFFSAA